ncbi:ATP-binding protein [Paenibacillus sp. TRM 82003]|uniref:ATP-binding protein n=1 Tax=Kineococcus sp. TRM81007 TaxID=2925831 RepID=UPI001F590D1A|nr:ATP-binding protein [Kineococcus sp. TRM81007]MCI2238246.1 ATP-binding protein [Kineococcus sp. TRM81007]MCI3924082.1 ATP-binding protein [Paenibacillus sp. TRM 82003]
MAGDATPGAPEAGAPTVEVRLLGLPLRTRARLSAHVEGLLRELALVRIGEERSTGSTLPRRLLELAVDLHTTYAPYRAQRAGAMEEALAAGEEFFDAVYDASPASAGYVRNLLDALEEADGFCRERRHLLTLPAPEELVTFRRWLFGEILRQLAGGEPRPWHGPSRREDPGDAAPPLPAPFPLPESAGGAAAGRVVGGLLVLESVASAVSAARRHVRRALAELGAGAVEESAEMAVSELVTNALLHAGTAFTVAVREVPGGRVRVEVTDASPVPVQQRHLGAAATTGRGLHLVAAASTRWGVDPLPEGAGPGKTVWCEPREAPEDTGGLHVAAWAGELEDLL